MATSINEAKLSLYEYQESLADAISEHRKLLTDRHEASQEYQRNRGNFATERWYSTEEIENTNRLVSELRTALQRDVFNNGNDYINSEAYHERVLELSEALNQMSDAYKDLIDLDKEYYETLIEHNNAFSDHVQKIYENAETFGEYESIRKYQAEVNNLTDDMTLKQKEYEKMTDDLNAAVNSGAIKKGSTEWLEQRIEIEKVRTEIRDYKNDIEEANQKILELEYEELFDRVIDKMDQFIDKIQAINGLLTDEMMYDYDTGKLTETGALALILNNNELDTNIAKLQKYAMERQRIMDDYANGLFGKETFDEKLKDVESSINSVLGDIDSARNNILTIIKDQTRKELDAIEKVLETRTKALQKKKEYYDYDRQLKNKNKEIQLLRQQAAALENVSNMESRAKKARLEAQLAEAQRDLDDTVQEHVYNLQVTGLDDLKTKLEEDYEKYVNEISKSAANVTSAINTAIETSGQNIDKATDTLNQTLGAMGADVIKTVYSTTTTGEQFEERINSENTDKIVSAIGMAAELIAQEKAEDQDYYNAKAATSESTMANELANKNVKYQGTFSIASSKNSGYMLDISGGSTDAGGNLQLYKSNGSGAQQFAFDINADGTYTIRNVKSGLVLDAQGGGTGNSTNVQQYTPNGTAAQKWEIIENSDGSVSFKNVKSGKMLDLKGGKVGNSTNMQLYQSNGSGAQKFYLKKLAKGTKFVTKDGTYLTQENGAEILSTKYGLLTPLSKGDGVIPADMTARLYDIAANYDKFDASGFKLPATIEGTTNNNNTVSYNVGDINIAGNTSLTRKDLEQFRAQIVEDVKNAIASDMRKYGYKPALA